MSDEPPSPQNVPAAPKRAKTEQDTEGFEEAINLSGCETIGQYLSVNVDAVKLPDRSQDKYPSLVIDGASGTGKTQQAFALLKQGHPLVYVLLVPSCGDEQRIYREMRCISGNLMSQFVAAQEEIESEALARGETATHGLCELKTAVQIAKDLNTEWPALSRLIGSLAEQTKKYVQEDGEYQLFGRGRVDNVKQACELLRGVTLFADEALPRHSELAPHTFNEQESLEAAERSRFLFFVRNLAGALGMRGVMVGASATAANLIPEQPTVSRQSRSGKGDPRWMDVHFLWRPPSIVTGITGTTDCVSTLKAALQTSRPVVLTVAQERIASYNLNLDNVEDRRKLFMSLGYELKAAKAIGADADLPWLCGSHLESIHLAPKALRYKSTELVRSHYFEPAVAVKDGSKCPYGGRGLDVVKQLSGDLRIMINEVKSDRKVFRLVGCYDGEETFTDETAAIFEDFDSVKYCLTNAVQQCLAREPVLALALSLSPRITDPRVFSAAVTRCCMASMFQHSAGTLGSLTFAMLQLACLDSRGEPGAEWRTCVLDFLQNLTKYILFAEETDCDMFTASILGLENWKLEKRTWQPSKETFTEMTLPEGPAKRVSKDEIEDVCRATMIPWLVPACSEEKLGGTIRKYPNLFADLHVAGLVPTSGTTSEAFDWNGAPMEPMKPCWSFEFKAQAQAYTLSEAVNDLADKCKNGCESHALLVGIVAQGENEWTAWKEGDYLRVVLNLNTN